MAKFGLRASAFSCSTQLLRPFGLCRTQIPAQGAPTHHRYPERLPFAPPRAHALTQFLPTSTRIKLLNPSHMQTARGLRIRRIKLNRSFQQLPSHRVVVLRARIDTGKRTHDTLPGVQAFRLLALCSYTLGGVKLRLNRCHYPLSYLVLKRKDAGEFPVIAFGPDM